MADVQDKGKSDSPKFSWLNYSRIAVNTSIMKAMAHSSKNLSSVRCLTNGSIQCLFNNTHSELIVLCVDSNVAKTSAKTRVHASVRNSVEGGRAQPLSLPMPEPLC